MVAVFLNVDEARPVVAVQVATQRRYVDYPVPLRHAGIASIGKAAVDSDTISHHKGNGAVRAGSRLIDAGRHPDLIPGGGGVDHRLQVAGGIGPGGAVARAASALLDIADDGRRLRA